MQNDRNPDNLPGKLARGEDDPESSDIAVNQAFDGLGKYKFYKELSIVTPSMVMDCAGFLCTFR